MDSRCIFFVPLFDGGMDFYEKKNNACIWD